MENTKIILVKNDESVQKKLWTENDKKGRKDDEKNFLMGLKGL